MLQKIFRHLRQPSNSIKWWETRRIPYNLIVLLAGFACIIIVEFVGGRLVAPGEDIEEPLGIIFFALIYGVAANACYTLSWLTEIYWTRGDPTHSAALRPKLFWAGVIFSVLLTFAPALLITLIWFVRGFP